MINTLLFVHLVIAILLIMVVLLQKTSTDGLSGIGGGNNMGIVSRRSAANFMTRSTIILATIFFANCLLIGNLSSVKHDIVSEQMQRDTQKQEEVEQIPMAK